MQRLDADQPDALQKVDQQQCGCGKLRGAERIGMKKLAQHSRNIPQQSGTECFTMSGTMMDNKPLLPSSSEPDPPLTADDATGTASSISPAPSPSSLPSPPPSSSPTIGARRESPLRDVFVGARGIYPGTRWLIYLAMAFVIFQLEG